MTNPPRPARAAGRRRLRPVRLLVVVGLLVLIGRGLGLVGRDDAPRAGPAPASTPPEPPPPPAPGPEALPERAREPEPAADGRPGIAADRFATIAALVTQRTDAGQLGDALAALHGLQGQSLDAEQRAALAALAAPLERAVGAACERWVHSLAAGNVLMVHAESAPLLADDRGAVGARFAAALAAAGAPTPLQAAAAVRAEPLPAAKPLPRGAAVRFVHRGKLATGTVADAGPATVTVRHEVDGAQSFPTIARKHVELVSGTRDDAVDASFAALHDGDVLLARLWFASARLRASEAPTAREALLARWLP